MSAARAGTWRLALRTIALVNEKGGTAKTTSTVNLAAALARAGHRTLVVDLDGQAATSRWLGVEEDGRLAAALVRGGGLEPIADVRPNLDLAPACGKIDSVAHELRPTQGGQLRRVLAEVADRYEFALIDCPPSLGNRLIGNAMLAANEALVPVETSILALDGLRLLLTMLGDVRGGFGHDIRLLGVLACRYDARTRLSRLVLAEMQRALPEHVFATVIRSNVRLAECPATRLTIDEYAPSSTAAADYAALAKEVVAGAARMGADALADVDASAYEELDRADRNTLEAFRERAATHFNRQRKPPEAKPPEAAAPPEGVAPVEGAAPVEAGSCPVADKPVHSGRAATALAASVALMIIGVAGWLVARQLSGGPQAATAEVGRAEPEVAVIAEPDRPPSPVVASPPDEAKTQAKMQAEAQVEAAVADLSAVESEPGGDAGAAAGSLPEPGEYLARWQAAAERMMSTPGTVEDEQPEEITDSSQSPDQSRGASEAAPDVEPDMFVVQSGGGATPLDGARLSGTMLGSDGGSAIINGRIVRHGQMWQGAKLVEVRPNAAVLEYAGAMYRLNVGAAPVRLNRSTETAGQGGDS